MIVRSWIVAAALAVAPLAGALANAGDTPSAPPVALVSHSDPADENSEPLAPAQPTRIVELQSEALTIDAASAPADLWDAAFESNAVFAIAGDGSDQTLYAPLGTWLPVATGGYLATDAGWWSCEHNVTAPEFNGGRCTPTGPVEPVAGLSWFDND